MISLPASRTCEWNTPIGIARTYLLGPWLCVLVYRIMYRRGRDTGHAGRIGSLSRSPVISSVWCLEQIHEKCALFTQRLDTKSQSTSEQVWGVGCSLFVRLTSGAKKTLSKNQGVLQSCAMEDLEPSSPGWVLLFSCLKKLFFMKNKSA